MPPKTISARSMRTGNENCQLSTYLWSADLVKGNKNKCLDEASKFYVSTISEWDYYHEHHLRHEQSNWHGTRDNPHQIQHVEIWWEIVTNITPCYVIPISVVHKFFTIPVSTASFQWNMWNFVAVDICYIRVKYQLQLFYKFLLLY